ncbi:MAG TPA: hypothetical protein VHV55_16090 [Pirellulales bacterium]|nr:hypothetical protein [Pirellulales bacterium]
MRRPARLAGPTGLGATVAVSLRRDEAEQLGWTLGRSVVMSIHPGGAGWLP